MALARLDVIELFSGERASLLELLESLTPEDWNRSTACPAWSVKEISIHLYGDDIGRLSRGRDGEPNSDFATGLDITTYEGLVAAIDRQNAVWVEGNRRISPRQLIELLELTGRWTERYFRSLDLDAPGGQVDWAGPAQAPVWLDLAREYTERWVHQQHIRDAVGKPGFTEPRWFAPVLDAFVRGLARPLAHIPGKIGDALTLTISGEAGGVWTARWEPHGWELFAGAIDTATATVEIDQERAWRLFTKGIEPAVARRSARVTGDERLAEAVFAMVSILA